jgi:glyoxylase-like metal-dependent hydrolase (beta-lactamase superfamily II)
VEIIPNVHHIPGVMANPYLILDADGLTLIDTGVPGSAKKILKYIHDLGRAPGDLRRILISHADMDHVGSLAALKAASGARVFASAIEAEAIAAGHPSRAVRGGGLQKWLFSLVGRFFKSQPTQVDEILSEGEVLPVLGGLRVVSTPGHTPGHISLFAPSVGVLFAGDSLTSQNGELRGSRAAYTWDPAKAEEAVRVQAALCARIVCAGHGPVVLEAAAKFPQV